MLKRSGVVGTNRHLLFRGEIGRPHRAWCPARGATAIEMTLILPLLLMILFGIVEMSMILYDQAMITNASREGARFGILFNADSSGTYSPMTDTDIQDKVNQYLAGRLVNFSPSSATTTVTPGLGARASGVPLTVRVEYNYHFLVLPNFVGSLAGDLNLAAQTVMRME